MSLFVIGDLHLSTASANKSMEVFGNKWKNYTERIQSNWRSVVNEEDTVVIPGDISWELSLEHALSDLQLIDALPGKKVFLKGNHDFWWSTLRKMHQLLEENQLHTISFLQNNAIETEDFILCGSRGWFQDEDNEISTKDHNYEKIVAREVLRLKMSLDAGMKRKAEHPEKEMLVFLHFPPIWNKSECSEFIEILEQYSIRRCYFGHIHGNYTAAPCVTYKGIDFILISADFLDFVPRLILPC